MVMCNHKHVDTERTVEYFTELGHVGAANTIFGYVCECVLDLFPGLSHFLFLDLC